MTKAEILDEIRGMKVRLNYLQKALTPEKKRRKPVRTKRGSTLQTFIDNIQRKSK